MGTADGATGQPAESPSDGRHDGSQARLDRRRFLGLLTRTGAAGIALRTGVIAATTVGAGAAGQRTASAAGRALGTGAGAHGSEVLHDWFRTLYSTIMNETAMTPGRAARIYAHAAVAGYEAVVDGTTGLTSLAGQLRDLDPAPRPSPARAIDWPTAASAAIGGTSASLLGLGSPSAQDAIATQLLTHLEQRRSAGIPAEVLDRSRRHGQAIAEHIGRWARGDGAEETVGRSYTPPIGEALWRSTPPNFGTAIDPYWGDVRTMALPSADFCAPEPPPAAFSTATDSAFWAQAQAVLDASDALTDQDRATALFWRDNPVTSGLPSGHWMLLTADLCAERGLSLAGAAEVLAFTGIALHDAFVSCWDEKYRTNLLRPVSYIRAHVPGRADWLSFVNTPQFPEYTSGHSVASRAAATVLADVLGVFPFTDRSHALRNPQLGTRSFASFHEAADQAAGSRLLGGIHYPMGIDVGLSQGEHVGRTVLARVSTRPPRRR